MGGSEFQYIDAETFVGDNKAFLARLVTMGWVARMRLRAKGHPLEKPYSGSLSDALKIVPLMYQLSERALVDLTEEYFHSPALHDDAYRLMLAPTIKSAADNFRLLLPEYGPEMMADYVTLGRWFDDRSVSFEGDGLNLQSPFLQSEEWILRTGWARCTLEFRSLHSVRDGITRVTSSQLAGGWSGMGYVRPAAKMSHAEAEKSLLSHDSRSESVSSKQGRLEREVSICHRGIEICVAMRVFAFWKQSADNLLAQQMQKLLNVFGLNKFDLYPCFVGFMTELVYWHERGHIFYDDMEQELASSLVSYSHFWKHYLYYYTELAADCYAIERCIDKADKTCRLMLLTTYLWDSTKLEDLHLCDLIKIRCLFESVPSAYIEAFIEVSIVRLRRASDEIAQSISRVGIAKGDPGWFSHVDAEVEKGDSFAEWQSVVKKRVQKEVGELLSA